jgi:hypothetical protein
MRRLAESHKNNKLVPDPVVYGSRFNNPSTWDADRVHGCLADEYGYAETIHNVTTFVGLNLDELQCPFTYDSRLSLPLGRDRSNNTMTLETQNLLCSAGAVGSFSLSFRGKSTALLSTGAKLQALQDALQALTNIGNVTILPDPILHASNTLCQGTNISISFITEFGNLPQLVPDVSNLISGTVHVATNTNGAGFIMECSGRGDCDRTTGLCKCWPYRTSSNGFGTAQGTSGDCGFDVIY